MKASHGALIGLPALIGQMIAVVVGAVVLVALDAWPGWLMFSVWSVPVGIVVGYGTARICNRRGRTQRHDQ